MKIKKWSVFLLLTILIASLSGCIINTTYEGSSNIIEVNELKTLLNESDVVVIDARSAGEYRKGHLKGAINLEASELDNKGDIKAMVASKDIVEKVLGKYGISNTTKVYIYDDANGVYASRIWWVLKEYGHNKVKVINGGAKAIVKAKLELSGEKTILEKTEYKAKDFDLSMYASLKDVKDATYNNSAVILDVRSKSEFDEGSIIGAINYSHTNNSYNDGTFKSKTDIYLNYNDLGLKKDDEIILYCKSSYRATQTLLLMKEAGFTNVRVYDGAFIEWKAKNMPIDSKDDSDVLTEQDAS